MTRTLAERTEDEAPPVVRPGRLRLRRRLLLWSIPGLLLLSLLAFKLASVGILGNRLPAQFAAQDQAAMASTLGWIGMGNIGRGFRERLAAGDLAMLERDLPTALEEFTAAHRAEPDSCPPRANFAITSETVSDSELRQGNFIRALALLEPASTAALDDRECFSTTPASSPVVRDFVIQTPDRLNAKLASLKAGYITQTPEGFDYIKAPGGTILPPPPPQTVTIKPCPYEEDDSAMRDCITVRDKERAAKVAQGSGQSTPQQPQQPQQSQGGGQGPSQGGSGSVPGEQGGETDDGPQFPGPVEADPNAPSFCTTDGTPLGDLAAALCSTSGPLP
ncbi:hypothetical protein [Mycolicibacterium sediminis]|uniref:Uncharacterized protein n=1 Tax=Mycolicibacterium sediminis TaxID=1286180 RepID=A0A7I7QMN6_9MYCO|nr:hypothetical protein [Mycolicibacterium sediminis]BBY27544.1 hypothetical protein MSEDJ_16400 [Mycolicibacterium sediminis]